jgi:mono/diheme cytochrome c family protein
MNRILLIVLSVLIVYSCSSDKGMNSLLNTDALPSQFLLILPGKDTVVKTEKGALLRIQKRTFDKEVKLEVKEAYSLADMIRGGLTTKSGSNPLSSGGMIYVGAGGNKMAKPIGISIPTESIRNDMQLWTGKDSAGKLDWQDPKPLSEEPEKQIAFGRDLFIQNCQQCHTNTNAAAPTLANFESRGPWKDRKQLYQMIRNTPAFIGQNEYMQCLKSYYGYIMTSFPHLDDKAIDAIVAYLKNEDRKNGAAVTEDSISICIDSCRVYDSLFKIVGVETEKLRKERRTMIDTNTERRIIEEHINLNPDLPPGGSGEYAKEVETVTPGNFSSIYYKFEIKSDGWYNVDVILERTNRVRDSELVVNIPEKEGKGVNTYLLIPSLKVFADGGPLEGKVDDYGFYTVDGKIKLPKDDRIIVFAISETEGDEILFASKEFTAKRKNRFTLDLQPVTKERFNQTILDWNLDNFSVKASDSRIAEGLRSRDSTIRKNEYTLESFRPKNCSCDCNSELTDSTSVYH